MIKKISQAITPQQAAELCDLNRKIAGQKLQRQHWDLPVIQNLLQAIQQAAGVELVQQAPSYIALEHKTQGHPVHADGCVYTAKGWQPNHMSWCKWSASVLVSDPALCSGGVVKFSDLSVTPSDHYCTLYVCLAIQTLAMHQNCIVSRHTVAAESCCCSLWHKSNKASTVAGSVYCLLCVYFFSFE